MASLVRAPLCPPSPPPTARSGYCLALHDHCLYLWAGYSQELETDEEKEFPVDYSLPDTEENLIEVYDILNNTWHSHETTGDVPDFGNGSTMVAYGRYLFLFGGWNEGEFNSEVYRLDVANFRWEHLDVGSDVVKPSPRYLTEPVVFESTMCVFGGVGPDPGHSAEILSGLAKYIEFRQFNHNYGFGWNNEMYFFDLEKHVWRVPTLSSDHRPPPCGGFSFSMIDTHRALLFGGKQEERRVADMYIFDFHKMAWSEVIAQQSPDQPWPAGRTFHSTTCLVDPQIFGGPAKAGEQVPDQQLLVLWGKGDDNKHCQDAWIYNLRTKKWKQMHTGLRHRMWHMACSYYPPPSFSGTSNTLLFGGNKQRSSNQEKHVMADLTIFSFGVLSLRVLCLEAIRQHTHATGPLPTERLSYVARNQLTEYTNATFYHLTCENNALS